MNKLLKRILGKLARMFVKASQLAKLMLSFSPLQELSEAVSFLQNLSPDLGKNCWAENSFEHTIRTCKLSVIVPAYNVEKYIADTLNSAIAQTLKDIEIVVVDDCSTDKTFEIVSKYAKLDRLISFFTGIASKNIVSVYVHYVL